MFDRFLQIIGLEPWEKRYRILLQQVRENPLLQNFVASRHGVELTIGRFLETMGSRRFDLRIPDDYAALSFIAPVSQIYDGLTSTGKTRLAGVLRDGLNTDRGLRPFQSEIETVTHLAHYGFDLTFRDLEGEPGFDFLAVRGDVEVEVECKSVSNDLGRQVHERQMAELSNRLHRALTEDTDRLTGGYLIRITVPARLPADRAALEGIVAGVQTILQRAELPTPMPCEIALHTFDIGTSPFAHPQPDDPSRDEVNRFVEEQLGLSNVHTFVSFSPGKRALVVVVDSQRRDRVVAELVRDLKEAAGQFSGKRPALLVVQFLELEAEAMLRFADHDSPDPAKASALQLATNLFLHSPERSHIHTVVYRSHGTLKTSERVNIQEHGPTYSFVNSAHPQAADPRYRPLRTTTA